MGRWLRRILRGRMAWMRRAGVMRLAAMRPGRLARTDGLRVLRPGVAEGTLAGGCISIFAEALGTPYAMLPASAEAPRILFLEDIGTKPYQWDRMLLHLRYAGMLEHVTGIVFGDMRQCSGRRTRRCWSRRFCMRCGDFAGPIAIGLRSGHVDAPNITLPLGVRVRLDLSAAENPRMEFLEAAVASLADDDAGGNAGEAYSSDWHLRDGDGVAGGDAAGAGAPGDGVGCGGVSADERCAGGAGDSAACSRMRRRIWSRGRTW